MVVFVISLFFSVCLFLLACCRFITSFLYFDPTYSPTKILVVIASFTSGKLHWIPQTSPLTFLVIIWSWMNEVPLKDSTRRKSSAGSQQRRTLPKFGTVSPGR